jgi:hypothetical protein
MNTKHSVIAPALSGKRSMLRHFVTAATMGVLMLGVASAAADGKKEGKGSYSVTTIAGVGCKDSDHCTGKLDVKGDGKFKVQDEGANLVFLSHIGAGKELNMKDGRQKHTCGDEKGEGSKIPGMTKDTKIKLTIEKSKLTFPEAGKEASGSAPAKVNFLGKESTVNVKYSVKEDGGHYVIKNASFDFDYTKHTGAQVCLMLICVRPLVNINISNGVVEASK